MNALKLQLIEAVKLFKILKMDYAVLGGVAVNIYGEPRFTADVDISILLEKDKIGIFLKTARIYGFRPACAKMKAFVSKTNVIPMNFSKNDVMGRCDFIIVENEIEKAAMERAVSNKVGSVKAKFISPEDLLIHKIISLRPHDREDVRGILIRQRGKLDMRYIKNWLRRLDKMEKGLKSLEFLERLLRTT